MAKALGAFVDGIGRVIRAPAVWAGVAAVTVLVALPAGHLIQADIQGSLGHSLAAGDMASGASGEWWDLYQETASGLGRSFTPAVIGFAAVLDNLSRVLDNQAHVPAVAAIGALYVALWLFLAGGILDRLARNRALGAPAFFAACGTFFWRFVRLGAIAAAGYYVLFALVHGWLFQNLYRWLTIDLTVERTAFVIRVVLYAVFVAVLAVWTLVFDYARARAVVEDRRSMLGAMIAGGRFVFRHPAKTGVLWLLNAAAFLAAVGTYALVAPGAGGAGTAAWAAFAVGQAYILARLFLKLVGYASQVALFQAMLAHAGYVASPAAAWPESPMVEAMGGPRGDGDAGSEPGQAAPAGGGA